MSCIVWIIYTPREPENENAEQASGGNGGQPRKFASLWSRQSRRATLQSFAQEMKPLLLILFLFCVAPAGAIDSEELVERLPEIRSKALADTADLRAGSTTEMVDAAVTIRNRLLPLIVTLESKLEKKSEQEVCAQLERDLEAVSRDAYIRGHSEGWGGTAVSVDSAWAVVGHLEARASWCVWQLMKDSKKFDFDAWHTRWATKSEQAGADQPATRSESKSEGNQKP